MSETSDERPQKADWGPLGGRLREARDFVGLSQEAVAQALGIPRPSVSAMESGKRRVSTIELGQLARMYGRSFGYFLGEPEEQPDEAALALYRATRGLSERDRDQLIQFADFLRNAGPAPTGSDTEG